MYLAYAILNMPELSDNVINQVHLLDTDLGTPFHGFVLRKWETEKIVPRLSAYTVILLHDNLD